MARVEYYQDSAAPGAHDLLPVAFAVVRDGAGRVLLVRRADDGNWELPGGRVDIGESATTAVTREVAEEAGIGVDVTAVSGVYSDPTHVLAEPDGQVHQQFAVCFHATIHDSGDVRPDQQETTAAAWFDPAGTEHLSMHPAMRQRLVHAVSEPDQVYFD
ncbi:NUDIX domain-containing protein [Amycolatopsis palatopharyngis]|uniref:NUDIX domain-containing protein n=1 Tax=Amycolatopsis palatopharyngis TaxID=187982 RepID=UPI000E260BFF|nr:NUDIX domain-containing protein [Amycolatopsis palatopharyngis]